LPTHIYTLSLHDALPIWKLDLKRFPKPVDRTLWGMYPQTINAYYNPLANQITFPAAILQPPFFDPNADAAANYGAIGAVIGHERSEEHTSELQSQSNLVC